MKSRLVLAATLALPFFTLGHAAASPVSYAFTGTLDTPFNGSREISGTVTLASAPTWISDGWPSIVEAADITLNAGGHAFEFSDRNPNTERHYFEAGLSPAWQMTPSGPRQDEIMFYGSAALDHPASGGVNFGITSYAPSPAYHADPSTFNFIPPYSSIFLYYYNTSEGKDHTFGGVINSFTPIATPEPATWMIALIVGGAAALRLRRRA